MLSVLGNLEFYQTIITRNVGYTICYNHLIKHSQHVGPTYVYAFCQMIINVS